MSNASKTTMLSHNSSVDGAAECCEGQGKHLACVLLTKMSLCMSSNTSTYQCQFGGMLMSSTQHIVCITAHSFTFPSEIWKPLDLNKAQPTEEEVSSGSASTAAHIVADTCVLPSSLGRTSFHQPHVEFLTSQRVLRAATKGEDFCTQTPSMHTAYTSAWSDTSNAIRGKCLGHTTVLSMKVTTVCRLIQITITTSCYLCALLWQQQVLPCCTSQVGKQMLS